MYELTVGEFKGPLEKLLELIEAEKMDVSEVSMARVTDDFLKYLDALRSSNLLEGVAGETATDKVRLDLRVLADFIAIASRLIFLKSKYLLPGLALTDEEEADIKDLEERLKRYQDLKPALRHLRVLWSERHTSYSRPYFLGQGKGLAAGQTVFYPGKNLDIEALAGALGRLFESIRTFDLETETIREKIISLEEKITEVIGRIRKEGDTRFAALSGNRSRAEMIVVFLAVLHLAREQLVLLEQIDNFSDIMVKKK
ncbi:MAG TPA: segregation/condensation protein A [Candidatus Paceibacterota bacterium]|nr:segregation/condensation protein A [Candidatus Paceibacterota bacterium]